MATSRRTSVDVKEPEAERFAVTADTLTAELSDGRTISAPLDWYPRLIHATPQERDNWELIGRGEGIHWPDLDEDISLEGRLAGRPSNEGSQSFRRWLDARCSGQALTLDALRHGGAKQ